MRTQLADPRRRTSDSVDQQVAETGTRNTVGAYSERSCCLTAASLDPVRDEGDTHHMQWMTAVLSFLGGLISATIAAYVVMRTNNQRMVAEVRARWDGALFERSAAFVASARTLRHLAEHPSRSEERGRPSEGARRSAPRDACSLRAAAAAGEHEGPVCSTGSNSPCLCGAGSGRTVPGPTGSGVPLHVANSPTSTTLSRSSTARSAPNSAQKTQRRSCMTMTWKPHRATQNGAAVSAPAGGQRQSPDVSLTSSVHRVRTRPGVSAVVSLRTWSGHRTCLTTCVPRPLQDPFGQSMTEGVGADDVDMDAWVSTATWLTSSSGSLMTS